MKKGLSEEKKRAVRGAVLAELKQTKKSTADLGRDLGVTQQNVSKARAGGAGAEFLDVLTDHLGVSSKVLVDRLVRGDYDELFAEDDQRVEADRLKRLGPSATPDPSGGPSPSLRRRIELRGRRKGRDNAVIAAACNLSGLGGVANLNDDEIDRLLDILAGQAQTISMYFQTVGESKGGQLADVDNGRSELGRGKKK